jgi:hypothetical protein
LTIESVDKRGRWNNSGGRTRDFEMFDTVKDVKEEARRRISPEIDRSSESIIESTRSSLRQKRAGGIVGILTKFNSTA